MEEVAAHESTPKKQRIEDGDCHPSSQREIFEVIAPMEAVPPESDLVEEEAQQMRTMVQLKKCLMVLTP